MRSKSRNSNLNVEINLKNAVCMAAEVWASVKDTTHDKAWNNNLPSDDSTIASEEPPN